MASGQKKGTARIFIWTAAVIVVVLVFYLAHLATRTVLMVRAYQVERGSITSSKSTNGKVQPVNNFEAHAPFPGLVRDVYVHEGDRVTTGQLLMVLDASDARSRLEQARSALAGAQNNLRMLQQGGTPDERFSFDGRLQQAQVEQTNSMHALEVLQQLAARGAASPSEVAQAKQRVATAESNLQVLQQQKGGLGSAPGIPAAQAQVADAQAGVAAAQDALSKATVRAPFAGTVYSIGAQKTDYVQQGDRLLQIADLAKVQVVAYFDEPDIGSLHVGEPVTITWVAKPGELWHGHIVRLPSTVVEYTTRHVGQVICSVDDPRNELLPDTNVTVNVTTSDVKDALYVPREALHTENGLNYVYKIEHEKLRRMAVQVGSTLNLTQIQILSGVSVGDVVALGTTTGQPLSDGIAVQAAQ